MLNSIQSAKNTDRQLLQFLSENAILLFYDVNPFEVASLIGKASPSQLRHNLWIIIGQKTNLGLYFPSNAKTDSGVQRKYSIRTQLYFVDQNSGNLTLVLGQGNEDFQFKVFLQNRT